ncbi:zinc ABC transporter substrate-binding protein [Corynebacterium sp. 35RC1]|nr:zinc ABC transporter substrate-binding protein [Corynebacterium sp. 35RC1]
MRTTVTLAALALALSACQATTPADSTQSTTSAASDASGTSTQALTIVASTSIWADVAKEVVGEDDAAISAIVTGNSIDPHTFEPTAQDIAAAQQADIVLVGGGGYDAWLYEAVNQSKVISAMDLTTHDHDHDHEHEHEHEHDAEGNEHIWYELHAVEELAQSLAERATELAPEATVDTAEFGEQLEALEQRLSALPEKRVVQTETIADYLIADSSLQEVTPEGYRSATLSHSEPSAADLAAMLEMISGGQVDIVVFNPQTQTDTAQRIREAAEAANVQVVEVYETPSEGESYLEFVTSAIERLEAATRA